MDPSTDLPSHKASARAGGKVILAGEHAVVYGVRAVVVGLDQGARAYVDEVEPGKPTIELISRWDGSSLADTPELRQAWDTVTRACGAPANLRTLVECELPIRAGLGSSAAIGVAMVRGVFAFLGGKAEADSVIHAAMQWERVFHGNPSGIDVAASVLGGALAFHREQGSEPVRVGSCLRLCVGYSGHGASTRKEVERVARMRQRRTAIVDEVFAEIGHLVGNAIDALARGDWQLLGRVFDLNHALLSTLLVSTSRLDEMCDLARGAGAFGAKLTGSGGGGCVIAIAPSREQSVIDAWNQAGFKGIIATIPANA